MEKKDKQSDTEEENNIESNREKIKFEKRHRDMQLAVILTHMYQHTINFIPELINLCKDTQTCANTQIDFSRCSRFSQLFYYSY